MYALYKRNKFIGGFLLTYIVAELGVLLWIYLTPSITRECRTYLTLYLNLKSVAAVVVPGPPSVNMIPVLHRMHDHGSHIYFPYISLPLLQCVLSPTPLACKMMCHSFEPAFLQNMYISSSTFQAGVFPVMQAMYDSVAFALIVFKTASTILRERGRYEDVRTLMVKNGLLYYA